MASYCVVVMVSGITSGKMGTKIANDGWTVSKTLSCRGMRLADTIFLTLPVALLQTWIGMRCSHPG